VAVDNKKSSYADFELYVVVAAVKHVINYTPLSPIAT
jgi:hypothetical protein